MDLADCFGLMDKRCDERPRLDGTRSYHCSRSYLVRSSDSTLQIGKLLTYERREAVYCIILSTLVDCIPLCLNGAIGAELHVPFPIALRASWGYYLFRFAVVTRMATALFWHAIQTYTGLTAMTQIIRSIWPSYLDIPNHLPESAGITSQQLLSHFIFWAIQFPTLLIPPHKLKWFFVTKAVVVFVVCTAVVIAMSLKAGGTGEI